MSRKDNYNLQILKIGGGKSFFSNQLLFRIFSYLEAQEIIRATRVCKSFKYAGRSNILWKEILKKKKEYFSSDVVLYTDFEGLDARTGNLCSKIEMNIKRSFYQAKRIRGEDSHTPNNPAIASNFLFFGFFGLVSMTSLLCPPLGVLLQGLVAYFKFYEIEGKESVTDSLPKGSVIDIFGSAFMTICGCCIPCCLLQGLTSCCFGCGLLLIPGLLSSMLCATVCGCIHAPNYAFIHLILWLGRFYFVSEENVDTEDEVAFLLATSPTQYLIGSSIVYE